MNKIQRSKKFQLFLERYDSRADARLDGILEKPLRAARSPHLLRLSISETSKSVQRTH